MIFFGPFIFSPKPVAGSTPRTPTLDPVERNLEPIRDVGRLVASRQHLRKLGLKVSRADRMRMQSRSGNTGDLQPRHDR